MCGIAGIFDLTGRRPIDRALLTRMTDSLAHRGPDGSGIHVEPGLGLGHRRLSIIDLEGGEQPLFSDDGSIGVTYNGEIYNFRELKEELIADGYVFRTHCDTEVIVYAWAKWGADCVRHFNGMFAFALWDRNRDRLFLARDRLGIKPLYYAVLPTGWLIFGSELKALLLHPDLPREMEPTAVEDYFTFGYVPDPKTILKSARKLAPAHVLTLQRGRSMPAPREYWTLDFEPQSASEADAGEALIDGLRRSVDYRLMADVPLGAFLSGGVDSSAVVAMMAGLRNDPVNTCSISFGDPSYNEAEYAAQVADRYRTSHHVEQVEPNHVGLIDTLVKAYDEPYADSSAIPTYSVCGLARKRVTVALSGDGGDENFAGYRRHRWSAHEQRVRSLVPQALRGPLFGFLGATYPKADWAPRYLRAKTTFQSLAMDQLAGYLDSVSIFPDYLRRRLFNPSFERELQDYRSVEVFRRYARSGPEDPLSLVQYLDLKTYLPGDILTKVDRASMAHSLEVRVPFLDHHFVEQAARLAPALKLKGREGKYILKKALQPYLPANVLYRPKMGFAVPLTEWFRGPLKQPVRETVLGSRLEATGIFASAQLRRLVDQHQAGVHDYAPVLWALLMFDGFLRQMEGDAPTTGILEPARSAAMAN
ncbi:MAG TPA: XrtA/PEP-CTERM system amidotransferase [Gammaproteobacteria bacterium]|nr:XrtA/PEP-CTERM system amidotransferase [Gammaproteobacteria bacterium]